MGNTAIHTYIEPNPTWLSSGTGSWPGTRSSSEVPSPSSGESYSSSCLTGTRQVIHTAHMVANGAIVPEHHYTINCMTSPRPNTPHTKQQEGMGGSRLETRSICGRGIKTAHSNGPNSHSYKRHIHSVHKTHMQSITESWAGLEPSIKACELFWGTTEKVEFPFPASPPILREVMRLLAPCKCWVTYSEYLQ